jgi:hypothetical protein
MAETPIGPLQDDRLPRLRRYHYAALPDVPHSQSALLSVMTAAASAYQPSLKAEATRQTNGLASTTPPAAKSGTIWVQCGPIAVPAAG